MLRAFCRPHAYTFSEQSKTAIALTPQTDITSEKVMASLQKMKLIKKHRRVFFFSFFSLRLNLKLVTHLSIISMVILHT